MSLQFIVGNSGSGKSSYIYNHIIQESIANPQKQYIIIVPEQFTMSTQKRLVMMHPKHAIMNIDILSFNRLAYRVFEELGTDTLEVLQDTGKSLLIRKVAQERRDELDVLSRNMNRAGYVDQVKSLISEFEQYNISPADLRQIIETSDIGGAFEYKAKDMLCIYEAYEQKKADKYITTEQLLGKLQEVITESNIVRDAEIVFDGFTGFTPVQNELLKVMIPLCSKAYFVATCDSQGEIYTQWDEHDVFAMSKKMISKLVSIARDTGVEIDDVIRCNSDVVGHDGRFAEAPELRHMEQNLFRNNRETYDGEVEHIAIYNLPNFRKELEYVASDIEARVRRDGLHYRDFAVLCADIHSYDYMAGEIFDRYHVPLFIDAESQMRFHPFIEGINALFEVLTENFSYASVMRLLRSGITDLTTEEIDKLDNYLLATGISGRKKFSGLFTVNPDDRYYSQDMLMEINNIRSKFYNPIGTFIKTSGLNKTVSVREITEALIVWIESYDVEVRLLEKAIKYEEMGDVSRDKVYEKIYGYVMDVLDKMIVFLGDEVLTVKEYAELLSAGFSTIGIATIPTSNDIVLLGDIERSRLEDIKVLYLIGANDGLIPAALGNGGIFSQLEREKLLEINNDIELAPTDRQRAFNQRFYLYLAMTKPSNDLVITYANINNAGESIRPSYIIATLKKLFTGLKPELVNDVTTKRKFLTPQASIDVVVDDLRHYALTGEMSEGLKACASLGDDKYRYFNRVMDAAFYVHTDDRISQAAVEAVFGRNISGSISQMEQYVRCAYAYFWRYGLRLKKRREADFTAIDKGNIYHDILDRYAENIAADDEAGWKNISTSKKEELIDKSIKETFQTMGKAQVFESGRDVHEMIMLGESIRQTIDVIHKQVADSDLIPTGFEVDFKELGNAQAFEMEIDDMHKMRLRGKIDRIDTYDDGNTIYVKIVDYKSSARDLKLNDVYNGLQAQLVTYLKAYIDGTSDTGDGTAAAGASGAVDGKLQLRRVVPAAIVYQKIDRPIISVENLSDSVSRSDSKAYENLMKAMQSAGYYNSDFDVLEKLETTFKEIENDPKGCTSKYYKSLALKKSEDKEDFTKGREFYATSKVLREEDFNTLCEYVGNKLVESGRAIVEGDINLRPFYENDNNNACKYCDFKGSCGFDGRLPGFEKKSFAKAGESDEEIIQRMSMDNVLARGEVVEKLAEGELASDKVISSAESVSVENEKEEK